jgi:hypothetical protein
MTDPHKKTIIIPIRCCIVKKIVKAMWYGSFFGFMAYPAIFSIVVFLTTGDSSILLFGGGATVIIGILAGIACPYEIPEIRFKYVEEKP